MTSDFQASSGEVVRRADLERAAGVGRFSRADPRVADYEGVALARAALAGDQAALDTFHDLAGLVLPGVTEHGEGDAVRLVLVGEVQDKAETRAAFQAVNQGGNDATLIDAAEIVTWILSPEGRAALERRRTFVPIFAVDLAVSTGPSALGAERRLAIEAAFVPVEESEYARGFNAGLREALRVANAKVAR